MFLKVEGFSPIAVTLIEPSEGSINLKDSSTLAHYIELAMVAYPMAELSSEVLIHPFHKTLGKNNSRDKNKS